MKTKLLCLLFFFSLLTVSAPTLYSQEDSPTPCEHASLERIKNWVPTQSQELFAQFILFQNLENVGLNFCTLAEAKSRLKTIQKHPEQHVNELKYLPIWIEMLEIWVQEEKAHWQETLPKFLSSEVVEKTLKKLEQWEEHCQTCVQKLPPHHRNSCRAKGLYHRHIPTPIPPQKH